jgi:hypothetical protein
LLVRLSVTHLVGLLVLVGQVHGSCTGCWGQVTSYQSLQEAGQADWEHQVVRDTQVAAHQR